MTVPARPLVAAIVAAALAVPAVAAPVGAGGCNPGPAYGRTADFNADGRPDFAIGAPYANVGGNAGAGAVVVAYGGAPGLGGGGVRVVSQVTPGVEDEPEACDHFGWSLAVGDYDCDGVTDLAVGVPDEDLLGVEDLGGVNILYGSPSGLVGRLDQGVLSWVDNVGPGDAGSRIGAALVALDSMVLGSGAAGSDGTTDLAVGAPGTILHPGGGVFVLSGYFINPDNPTGRNRMLTFDVPAGSQAGAALAAGDIDDDPTDDLIVGIPRADKAGGSGPMDDTGALGVVLDGAASGFVWFVGEVLPGKARAGDRLGSAVAVGDVNGDGLGDIVAGMPDRDAGATDAGAIVVIPSKVAPGGPNPAASVIVHQNSPGILGKSSARDRFGASVAAGNMGSGGAADIAVGIPGAAVGGRAGAGAVAVLYGGFDSFGARDQRWDQGSSGIPDAPERDDAFGSAVSIAQLGGGSALDLAIGVPLEDLKSTKNAGGALVLFGSSRGLNASGARWFTRSSVTKGSVTGKARLGFSVR
jgi:hypothetical protein